MSAMDAKVLRRAAELIDMGHCKNALAQDAEHRGLMNVMDPNATAWCIAGAYLRANGEVRGQSDDSGWDRGHALLAPVTGGVPVAWNNDPGRTADEVAAALRQAADWCDGVSPEARRALTPPGGAA